MDRTVLFPLLFVLAFVAQFFGLQRCATPSPPNGGPRDSLGPVLVLEESTPNFQTNFRPERIELTFDEWVELDPQQQIIISPPLDYAEGQRPELRRRTLVIPLEGVPLRDSVTYVVNIGAAVKDLNEGNPTENLRFVFATGPELDTASVSGQVVDAYTGDPLENIAVTLYDNLADSAVFIENPTYFAQTTSSGAFTVSNVRPGAYRVVALERNPAARGYYADFGGLFPPLAVGFLDSIVTVAGGDTPVGTIRVSPIARAVQVQQASIQNYGLIKLALNQPAANVDLRIGRTYLRDNFNDTLRLFYREPAADTLLLGRNGEWTDTVIVDGLEAGDAPREPFTVVDRTSGRVNPGEGIRLVFNRPVETADTGLIRLYRDTFPDPVPYTIEVDTVYPAEIRLRAGWGDAAPYRLEMLPGAVTDWYGQTNQDSIVRTPTVDAREKFGDLTITLENLNPTIDYLLRLVNESGEVILGTRRYIHERFDYVAEYLSLQPGTYRMELIYDSNGNERYDSGDLRFGLQPEAVERFEIEPLRANWTVEKTIDLENN
ncbi:Ig-like domain-containing protein [Lewinella sp. IMCC34183]|uniref:Ig-like domain-containing protein n=1 Tax=Lewinella sp. IMCC34183 TaxID=2248762 RepID=UPI000E259CCA|nr:Ig-like domain-containing protein [Lewinella sp. IMCC34183]